MTHAPVQGKVYLVGAGPGDPGLLTLRGRECLELADVVLYDYLVNPVMTRYAPSTAECICLGRHGSQQRPWTQETINERLRAWALAGRQVVRLKGGDPAVFARGGEEADFLIRHRIPLEIVPGITAALAAGSYAGVPLTHREHASAVALVTGHEDTGKEQSDLDYASLSQFPGTLVFYMGVTTVAHWSRQLLHHGMPAATPVAVVRRCSTPEQDTLRCRLDEVEHHLTPYAKFPPPAIVIVGRVAAADNALTWFETRPLFRRTILVSRPAHQAAELARPLAERGARVLLQPAIELGPPPHWTAVDAALRHLADYSWIVFSSTNGVDFFLGRLRELGFDLRVLGGLRLAAIGSGTAAALARYHLQADLVPAEFRAEGLARELAPQVRGVCVLLVRTSRGRDVLPRTLRDAGAQVDEIVAYQSRDVSRPDPEILKTLEAGHVDWVTVTSSAIAKSLVALFGPSLRQTKLASISPVTSQTLRELGFEPHAEARPYTMPGLVEAIVAAEQRTSGADGPFTRAV